MSELMQGQTLQILLIATSEAVQDEVSQALSGSMTRPYRLHWVAQPHLAFVRAQDLLPQVILVDDDLDDTDPIPVIRRLASTLSNTVILFLVRKEDAGHASQAILVGARSFITKPIQSDELVVTLHQVLAWQRTQVEPRSVEGAGGRIVVFCAPKGGTGRTTLALNTAISLHEIDKRPVVVVDADFAAPAIDVALNLDLESNVSDLLPRLTRLDEDLIESVLAEHASGIKALLAPPPADLSAPLTLPQVQHILVMLKRMFPWVIVDLGLPMDETAFAFLDGADRVIMTVLPEMVGLRNTRLMLAHFADEGYPVEKTWLVLNRSTIRGGVSQENIERRLGVPVQFTVPDDQPLVTHTINRGVPLMLTHARSAVARGIRKIAKELSEERRLGAAYTLEAPAPARRGLFGLRSWTRSGSPESP
ncbi:MAG: response regulator [Anaerolineae bacterium]|nr:response regulator [Anaerolineae bacterium]